MYLSVAPRDLLSAVPKVSMKNALHEFQGQEMGLVVPREHWTAVMHRWCRFVAWSGCLGEKAGIVYDCAVGAAKMCGKKMERLCVHAWLEMGHLLRSQKARWTGALNDQS